MCFVCISGPAEAISLWSGKIHNVKFCVLMIFMMMTSSTARAGMCAHIVHVWSQSSTRLHDTPSVNRGPWIASRLRNQRMKELQMLLNKYHATHVDWSSLRWTCCIGSAAPVYV